MDEQRKWYRRMLDENFKIVSQAGKHKLLKYPFIRDQLEDLIHDTFIAMNNQYPKLRNHENITGWLVKTIENKIKERATQTHKQLIRIGLYIDDGNGDIAEAWPDPESDPERALLEKEAITELCEALKKELGSENYRLFMAHYVHKVPIEKLAYHEGMTPAALKMRLHRMRQRLRKKRENFQR